MHNDLPRSLRCLVALLLTGLIALSASKAFADDEPAPKPFSDLSVKEQIDALAGSALELDDKGVVKNGSLYSDSNSLWTCLAAFLVFFMQAGFALVEAGLTRAKNTCNILMKNMMDFCIGTPVFWLIGFGLMFSATTATHGWIGGSEFMFDAAKDATDKGVMFGWSFLIFQTVFCATAATIVSGAMAERTKFSSYLIYTVLITGIVYPVFGCWAWGNLWHGDAWLAGKGFHDFAGSTVVHSIGGWAALAGAIVVGPRIGKFVNGKVMPIPGHSIPMVMLGVFILWLGWFGFNPGSTTAVGGGSFAKIAITTNISACGGALMGMITSWVMFKKPDVSFTMNGCLAGLVAITAGCDAVEVPYAFLIGAIAGTVVVLSCVFFDKIRVDDPVGAISVHGVCGALGTLLTGVFGTYEGASIAVQAMGVGIALAWSFSASMVVFLLLKFTVGLRVSAQEELDGLDMHEHGMGAYPAGWIAVSEPLTSPAMSGGGGHGGSGKVGAKVGAPSMAGTT